MTFEQPNATCFVADGEKITGLIEFNCGHHVSCPVVDS
jgi:hypothetical protein